MGNITELSNRYNNEREQLREDNIKNKKTKLNDHGTIGTLKLVAPSSGKKYKLTSRQRAKRSTIRGLIAAGALATYLATNIGFNNSTPVVDTSHTTETNVDELDKQDVLSSAESKLLKYIYGKNSSSIENAKINYVIDKVENTSSITVTNSAQLTQKTDFEHIHSNFFQKKDGNAKEINSMLDKMIDIYYDESPSQDELQELSDAMEVLDDMNIEFDRINRTIINADEKEKDDGER